MEVEHVDHLVDECAHGDIEIRAARVPDDDELVLDAATASHCERGHRVFQPPVSHGAGRDQLSLQSELRYAASQLVLKQPVVYRVEHQMHVVVVYVERLVRVPQRVLERRLEILDDTGLFGFKYRLAHFHAIIYSPELSLADEETYGQHVSSCLRAKITLISYYSRNTSSSMCAQY